MKNECNNTGIRVLEDGNKIIHVDGRIFPPEKQDTTSLIFLIPPTKVRDADLEWKTPVVLSKDEKKISKTEGCGACQTHRPREKVQPKPQLHRNNDI